MKLRDHVRAIRDHRGVLRDLHRKTSDRINEKLELDNADVYFMAAEALVVKTKNHVLCLALIRHGDGWHYLWFVDSWQTIERGTASYQILPEGTELFNFFEELDDATVLSAKGKIDES